MKNYYEEDQKLFAAVKGFKEGSQDSYYIIYDLSVKYIYKIVYDIIKEHHATEDLVQETYLTIYNKIASLDDVSKFYAWAGRIATNHTFRYIQKNKRELLTLDSEDGAAEFAFEVATQDNEEFIPENILMDKEKQRLIAQIIDGLSTEQKLAVQYFYYEEMSVTEIAETMGCARGTIMSRLNYARKAIKAAVVDLAENQGTKLYSLGSLPLFYIVFRSSVESFTVATLAGASGIISEVGSVAGTTITNGSTAVGTAEVAGSAGSVVSTTAGTGVATGTEAAAGVGAGTAVGTGVAKAAATGAAKGILGKIGASLGAKIAAGVLTAGLLTTGGIMLHNAVTEDDSAKRDKKSSVKTESSVMVGNEESKSEEDTSQKISIDISEVGQIVEFGCYEQDGDESNGAEPIEWEVLSIEDGRALLISKYVLDAVPFSSTYEHKSWEESRLRAWLNKDFLNTAFSEEEQKIIPTVTLTNPGNEYAGLEADADTQDQIFVLSVEEVFRYYDFFYVDDDGSFGLSKEIMAEPTEYAITKGVRTKVILEDSYVYWLDGGWPQDIIGKEGAKWWLRTPGRGATVCMVSTEMAGEGCGVNNIIDGQPDGCQGGVRPALYLEVITDSEENENPEENPTEELEPTPELDIEDYAIEWKDEYLEVAMREVTGIYDRDIMYSDVKDITDLDLSASLIRDISALGSLVNLTSLNLSENYISDIASLSNLTNLTSLNLGYNSYISDVSALSNLTKLTKLWLRHNQISDISALSGMTNLTELHLGVNCISDLSVLSNLTNLTELHLDGNTFNDISVLSGLTNLETLCMSHCNISDISVLSSLTNLRGLDISSTNVSDISVLSNLTNLYYLYLPHENITDYSPVSHVPSIK